MKKMLVSLLAVILAVIITLIIADWASGESAEDAIRALKKLEAKCQIGISYNKYFEILGDAQFDINMFLESNQADINPKLSDSIFTTLEHYKFAGLVLEYTFSKKLIIYHRGIDKDMGMDIIYKYPKSLEALVHTNDDAIGLNPFKVIKIIWGVASDELRVTMQLLNNER